ncbi:alpha/beta fold hydrolase [Serinicoccus hydrothermalis]|uniref:alpha/beta fold hydrolase n=1 Tax=Serinicoccus hydrothermalis TaxID=1758689 RepID=UPI001F38902C|nr:alpha/beta hydrolase [Serinicoccus hydrothermalis]
MSAETSPETTTAASTESLPSSVEAVLGERYRSVAVPVDGGDLHVGVWEPEDSEGAVPTVVLVHGITASHVSFAALAQALPGVRLVAPDLRGRGRSRDLPAPYGMPRHADDVAAVLHHLGVDQAVAVGHSMGAFVSLVLADRHPDLVRSLLLVDGGMPLLPPPGVAPEDMAAAVLGPAADRLRMTFPSREAYHEFWREHPALGPGWDEFTTAYVDYDLVGEEPGLTPATRPEALAEDIRELVDGASVEHALDALTHPATWLVAPRGLLDEVPPLYPDAAREHWTSRLPRLRMVALEDVNHYTVVLAQRGVRQLLPLLEGEIA